MRLPSFIRAFMLILTRRVGEIIRIGDNIAVIIAGTNSRSQVSLGIEAPPEVSVHREEIKERILNEK